MVKVKEQFNSLNSIHKHFESLVKNYFMRHHRKMNKGSALNRFGSKASSEDSLFIKPKVIRKPNKQSSYTKPTVKKPAKKLMWSWDDEELNKNIDFLTS